MSKPQPPTPPVVGGHPAKHSGKGNHPVTRVVIHSAVMPCEVGRARQLAAWNRDGVGGGSWHYAVDPAEVIQCSYDSYVCWHAPPNGNSLGIEMADNPGPVPGDKPGTAAYKAAKRSWRWARKPQRLMLKRTAALTAGLCLAYDLPVMFLTTEDLRAGRKGITTHNYVSKAFGQSSHWDPGFWPKRRFMAMVRREVKRLEAGKSPWWAEASDRGDAR